MWEIVLSSTVYEISLKNAGCLASYEMIFRKIKSQKCIPSPSQLKHYSEKKIPFKLACKGPFGKRLAWTQTPRPRRSLLLTFPSNWLLTGDVRRCMMFALFHCFFIGFQSDGIIFELEANEKMHDSNLCIYKKKDSLCLLLMPSNPQVGKKLLLGFLGIKIIEM